MIAPTSFFADYGCHVRILEEIHALQGQGHRVRVCTYHNGDDMPGIDITRTVDIPWRKRVVVGSSKHKLYLDVMLFAKVLQETIKFKPDLIHAHLHEGALIGSVVGRVLRIPVVFDYQGSLTEEMLDHGFIRSGGLRHRFFRRLEKVIDNVPARIMPSSRSGEAFLLARGHEPRRVTPILDAVDLSRFDDDQMRCDRLMIRREMGIPDDAPVVVYLGLLATYQGTPLLIEAAREILSRRSDVYFIIAGYPAVGRHSRMAENMPVEHHVLFPGRILYKDAPALLAAGDVAVAPKLSVTEGNGKILTYMAAGLPVVAMDNPANRAMLGPDGMYVKPHDPSALAAAIEDRLSCHPGVGQRLRERVTCQNSWTTRVLDLEKVYEEVLRDLKRR